MPKAILSFVVSLALFTTSIDDLATQYQDTLPAALGDYDVPGVAIGVVQNGLALWSGGYGLANVESETPVTVETRFNIGSVSKTITAWGVMTLVEADLVDLDTPIDSYLTRWHLPPSDFDNTQVTVRRILSHTAGLSVRGYSSVFLPGDPLITLEESLDGYRGSDGRLRVILEPGTEYLYSSGGYALLQLLVEEVSGQSFADYIQQAVFEPLGMTHSAYEWTPELEAVTATPYRTPTSPFPQYQFVEQASGGLYTTAGDLALLVAAAMDGGEDAPIGRGVLSPETVREMIQAQGDLPPHSSDDELHGLGYQILPLSEDIQFVGHDGSNDGWRALFLSLPERGDGIILLTNGENGGRLAEAVICPWAAWAGIEMSPPCPST